MQLFKTLIILFFLPSTLLSQPEARYWYFGNKAGLDFNSNPPQALSNGQMIAIEGCSSISDVNGNLLFYTGGDTVWNKQHQIMANGTGLFAGWSNTQATQIVKWPGSSSKYFLFTLSKVTYTNGPIPDDTLFYHIIDMSLAAGNGSVISKNNLLRTGCAEKMCIARHCDNISSWLIVHQASSGNFVSFLINASGLVTQPVISASNITNNHGGQMKVSPNGRKLAMANFTNTVRYALFDFNSNNGVISNSVVLLMNTSTSNTVNVFTYGCEFSPDGTKLYGSFRGGGFQPIYPSLLHQWDLCAGSSSNIVNSILTTTFSLAQSPLGLQLGPDKKIYLAHISSNSICVINNPNNTLPNCNFQLFGISLANKQSYSGLPSFHNDLFRSNAPNFTFSAGIAPGCHTYSFFVPNLDFICNASTYQSLSWNFNDPLSGAANTSTLNNPLHQFSAAGTYTVLLLLNTPCTTDTVRQQVFVNSPSLLVSGKTALCPNQTTTLTVSGANTFTWNGNVQSNTISLSPTVTTQYTVAGTNTLNGCAISKTFSVIVNKCLQLTNNEAPQNSIHAFPNPVNHAIYFDIPFEKNISISIYNQLGQLLFTEKNYESLTAIDLKDLQNDFYYYKIITSQNIYSGKFLKE
jgi:hypothetical protein